MRITTINAMGVTSETGVEARVYNDFATVQIGGVINLFGDRDMGAAVTDHTRQLVSLANLELFFEQALRKIRKARAELDNLP